jgi:methoxymalonate biosynthesis acyl carrier protein
MKKILDLLSGIRPEFDFSESADFFADGMLDSFDLITLVSDLDKAYAISIDGTDIVPENFRNVDAIAALLVKAGATP